MRNIVKKVYQSTFPKFRVRETEYPIPYLHVVSGSFTNTERLNGPRYVSWSVAVLLTFADWLTEVSQSLAYKKMRREP